MTSLPDREVEDPEGEAGTLVWMKLNQVNVETAVSIPFSQTCPNAIIFFCPPNWRFTLIPSQSSGVDV